MDKQELYNIWAPGNSIWSPWAKPVLFAHYPMHLPELPQPALPDLSEIPPARERPTVIIDFPGPQSIFAGLALAEMGYRPVPLYNACPPPADYPPQSRQAAVDMDSILAALVQGAERLRSLTLPDDAPPAFLVNADRQGSLQAIHAGHFDNCSVVFITDFPSANFLAKHGIRRAILLHERDAFARRDLAYVLWTWQKAGVSLNQRNLYYPGPPQPMTIGGSWFLFGLWHRLCAFFDLHRHSQGGFGGFVGYDPEASEAAGG